MSRAARPWLAGAVLCALLLGGCGIPDNTPVLDVGPGPALGNTAGGASAPVQPGREDSTERVTFVDNYLQAAAGDPDDAVKRAKSFLAPSVAAGFKAQSDIRVVHLNEEPLNNPGSDDVVLRYQVIGTLGHTGTLDPSTADGTAETTTLVVGEFGGQYGLFLKKAPPYLMISDTALELFYERHPIYFWNAERTGLVPDIRYMPRTVPAEQQPTRILSWLIDGPAPWLQDAVDALPDNTALVGNVPAQSDDKLQISLNDQAVPADDPQALDRLRRQLQWSLRPLLPKTLELRIGRGDPSVYSDTDYLTSNFAYRPAESPERFAIYDDHVRRLASPVAASVPIPVLTAADNKNVRSAALSTSGPEDFAALVVNEAKGRQSLRVGVAKPGQQAPLKKSALPAPIGHPAWAITPDGEPDDAVGLVPAAGKLYSFTAAGAVQQVGWAGAPGDITGVAIAPDGHRIALLAGGRLYLTVFTASGDGPQMSEPSPVRTPLLTTISAVDWSSEAWLAVAGVKPQVDGGRVTVMDMTIDGAEKYPRVSDLGDEAVTYLTAYPANPMSEHSDSVSYVAGNASYDALQAPLKITVSTLAEAPANPPNGVVPTAPLFRN
jgi:hypothetical protein